MNRLRTIAATLAVTGFAVAWFTVGVPSEIDLGAQPVAPVPGYPPAGTTANLAMLGVSSCAGQGCHGRPIPEPLPASAWAANAGDLWRSSYTIWRAYDPHAEAYSVLLGERSRLMVARLGPDEKPAHENLRCLACHTNPTLATRTDEMSRALHAEGVGCESCHGPSGTWIDSHIAWRQNDTARPTGLADLANIETRADTCAGCHVGAAAGNGVPLRDVNHDLIAAGHPRLNFDFATYLRALPPHWVEHARTGSDSTPRPDSDGWTHWAVGKAVTTAAALDLLADRATRQAPWPELAEFRCYACHFELGGAGQNRQGDAIDPRAPMPWAGPPLLRWLAQPIDRLRSPTDALNREMSLTADPAKVGPAATRAASAWRADARG